jgi:cysteine-rich repeat protein
MRTFLQKITKHASYVANHVSRHKNKYSFGLFGSFAIVKMALLFAGFLGYATLINTYATPQQTAVCGNTILEPGEVCDDGNLTNGDGCDEFCTIEWGYHLPEGIAVIYYSINSGDRQIYTWIFALNQTGIYTIQTYAIDDAGNTSETLTQDVEVVLGGECASAANACWDTATGTYICNESGSIVCSAEIPIPTCPICGDGSCNGNETCTNCPKDCGTCGWGWWGGWTKKDDCTLPSSLPCANDNGNDASPSFYDNTCCGTAHGSATGVICSLEGSTYSTELEQWYMYACDLAITTKTPITTANVTGPLLRKHLAKMMTEFAIRKMWLVPNTKKPWCAW